MLAPPTTHLHQSLDSVRNFKFQRSTPFLHLSDATKVYDLSSERVKFPFHKSTSFKALLAVHASVGAPDFVHGSNPSP